MPFDDENCDFCFNNIEFGNLSVTLPASSVAALSVKVKKM